MYLDYEIARMNYPRDDCMPKSESLLFMRNFFSLASVFRFSIICGTLCHVEV